MLAHRGWVAYGSGVASDYHTGEVGCTCGECVMRRIEAAKADDDQRRRNRDLLAAEKGWRRRERN